MDDENILIVLSPLEAVKFKPLLRMLADSIEATAVIETRAMYAGEDLQIDICANIDTQIAIQSDKINESEVESDMKDYTRQYQYEQRIKAQRN